MKWPDKRIVLTGAASGIGLALWQQLAVYPLHLLAVDLNAAGLAEAIRRIKGPATVTPLAVDVSTQAANDLIFDAALARMSGIDLFFANAGFAYYEKLGLAEWQRLEKIYAVNVFAPIYCATKMAHLYGDSPHKTIITASAMGRLGLAGYAVYASTKAALDRFAESYRLELADPTSLVLVYPVATRTRFFETAHPQKQAPIFEPSQRADTVAQAILTGIDRNQTEIIPSRLFRWLMLMGRFLPALTNQVKRDSQRQFEDWLNG